MRSFWDLNEALKCIQEGESHVNKLRKPEAVRALAAMAWFVRSIPGAPELLQEVRALAGRVTDGLDKPGTADYVDHPWRALMAQKGLTPYSYTLHLKQSGVPQAPPPVPGHAPAWSYVPDTGPGAAAQAASGGLGEQEEEEDSIFSGLGTLSEPGGGGDGDGGCSGGDGDDGGGQVSAPRAHDDHARVGVVDDSVQATGNVRTPAATDPLVDAGSTVGRKGAGQSQGQAGAQVQGPADYKRKLCKSVWRDDVCRVKECDRAHPPRCGDPRCFPVRRSGCLHWHRLGGVQRQQQQQQRRQQHQGNGSSAGPGSAGRQQAQGRQQGQRPWQGRQGQQQQQPQQPAQRARRGVQQQGGLHQQQQLLQRQQQQQQPWGGQQRQRPHQQHQQRQQGQGRQLQQRQFPSYRDVAALGTSHSHSTPLGGGSPPANVGFAPVQPDRDMLNTVVATVLAVLAGRQHF